MTDYSQEGAHMKLFGAEKIITEHISEADLCTYFVGFDLDDRGDSIYRLKDLVTLLICVIPEFALGFHRETTRKPSKFQNEANLLM